LSLKTKVSAKRKEVELQRKKSMQKNLGKPSEEELFGDALEQERAMLMDHCDQLHEKEKARRKWCIEFIRDISEEQSKKHQAGFDLESAHKTLEKLRTRRFEFMQKAIGGRTYSRSRSPGQLRAVQSFIH
jgi:hypothetical protein